MARTSVPVVLTEEERLRLAECIRAGATPEQVVLRALIIDKGAAGQSVLATAAQLRVHRRTVALWRRRVRKHGIGCVWEVAAGRGRKLEYDSNRVAQLVEATQQAKPTEATHWSTRTRWPERKA